MNVFSLIRPFRPVLIGSAALGVRRNDIDILICVPDAQLGSVEQELENLGFVAQQPQPQYTDKRLVSAWKREFFDVQIATPANYSQKLSAHRSLKKTRGWRELDKAGRYRFLCGV